VLLTQRKKYIFVMCFFSGEKACVYASAWNPSGPELATADKGGFITIWM
jgi:hypothetical protein